MVKLGSVSVVLLHATFDHAYLDSRVYSRTTTLKSRYMRSPMSRSPGFFLTTMANAVSTAGAVYCTFMYNQTPLIGYAAVISYVGVYALGYLSMK